MPAEVLENIKLLANELQKIRDYFDASVSIISGYRSPEYNDHEMKPRGAKYSQHKLGKAADIVVRDFTPDQVADQIERMINEGILKQGGLGRYNTFTHYDIRGEKARWDKR